jgi:hypothetical protein
MNTPHNRPFGFAVGPYIFLAVASPVAADDPAAVCAVIEVGADRPSSVVFVDGFERGDQSLWGDPVPAFSATEILDVTLEVGLDQDLPGIHLLELSLTTPTGHLYQVLTAPVSSQPELGRTQIRVTGFPYPLEVAPLRVEKFESSVRSSTTLRLPVAGTPIVTHSLYGLWQVEVRMDGVATTCGGTARFILVQ